MVQQWGEDQGPLQSVRRGAASAETLLTPDSAWNHQVQQINTLLPVRFEFHINNE